MAELSSFSGGRGAKSSVIVHYFHGSISSIGRAPKTPSSLFLRQRGARRWLSHDKREVVGSSPAWAPLLSGVSTRLSSSGLGHCKISVSKTFSGNGAPADGYPIQGSDEGSNPSGRTNQKMYPAGRMILVTEQLQYRCPPERASKVDSLSAGFCSGSSDGRASVFPQGIFGSRTFLRQRGDRGSLTGSLGRTFESSPLH